MRARSARREAPARTRYRDAARIRGHQHLEVAFERADAHLEPRPRPAHDDALPPEERTPRRTLRRDEARLDALCDRLHARADREGRATIAIERLRRFAPRRGWHGPKRTTPGPPRTNPERAARGGGGRRRRRERRRPSCRASTGLA